MQALYAAEQEDKERHKGPEDYQARVRIRYIILLCTFKAVISQRICVQEL